MNFFLKINLFFFFINCCVRLSFLQASDVAVSVPNSLVVTLERVLGNETLGKV